MSLMARTAMYLPFARRVDDEIRHARNIESIKIAARSVDKGELVILYPAPKVYGKGEKWRAGLGYLIKQIKRRKNSVYIVYAHTRGPSKLDYLRIYPKLSKFLPKVKMKFITYRKLSDLDLKLTPREIVRELEKDYKSIVV